MQLFCIDSFRIILMVHQLCHLRSTPWTLCSLASAPLSPMADKHHTLFTLSCCIAFLDITSPNLHFSVKSLRWRLHHCTLVTSVLLYALLCLLVIESLLVLFCSLHWKLVLPTNPLHAASPPSLFIVHSISLPPSFFFLSITPWEPTFFSSSVFHVAFPLHLPPPHIHLCALLRLSHSNYMCISTSH